MFCAHTSLAESGDRDPVRGSRAEAMGPWFLQPGLHHPLDERVMLSARGSPFPRPR